MLNKILPLLNKALPVGLAIKGLGKIDPRLSNFASGAFGAGYTADQVIDFLRTSFENPGEKGVRKGLDQRAAQGTARPDELAAKKRIGQTDLPYDLLKGGAALAGGLGAIQGLGAGEQNNQGKQPSPLSSEGLAQQAEGMQQEAPQQDFNIDKWSPQILAFIKKHIDAGQSIEEAAMTAQKSPLHAGIVKRIEQGTGQSFIEWVKQQLGGGGGQSNGGQGGVKGTLMEQTAMGLELLRKLTGQNG